MSFDGGQGGRGAILAGLVLVSVLFVASFGPPIAMMRRSAWPTVEGRTGRVVGETWMEFSDLGQTKRETHIDHIDYKYVIDGKEYRGTQGVGSDGEEEAARHDRLAYSPTVTVRYDPGDPATSELVDRAPGPWWLTPWWLPLLSGALLAVCVVQFRRARW